MKLYHIVSCLEDRFDSIEDALKVYNRAIPVVPRIPMSKMPSEDGVVERICVSESLYDCFKSIGILGTFRRCLASNEDAKSYETSQREVYPILILTFDVDDSDIIRPTSEQVPDCDLTNELWLVNSIIPSRVEVKWLHSRSIIMDDAMDKVIDVKFVDPKGYSHLYLNGLGNPLDSSNEEYRDSDIPFYVTHNIFKELKSAGYNNIVVENNHNSVCFVEVSHKENNVIRDELLSISTEHKIIEITHWSSFVKQVVQDEIFYMLCEYSGKQDASLIDFTKKCTTKL